jgi:hypothetical protein
MRTPCSCWLCRGEKYNRREYKKDSLRIMKECMEWVKFERSHMWLLSVLHATSHTSISLAERKLFLFYVWNLRGIVEMGIWNLRENKKTVFSQQKQYVFDGDDLGILCPRGASLGFRISGWCFIKIGRSHTWLLSCNSSR